MIVPRCSNGTPMALNSRRYHPDAIPIRSRPSDSRSMHASRLARITGLRIGSTRMPVPSLILLVRAAMAVSRVKDAMIGKLGSTRARMWSQIQIGSSPSCSFLTPYWSGALPAGSCGWAVKVCTAIPNVRAKPVILNSSSCVERWSAGKLCGVELLGIELAQHFQLLIGRRLGHAQVGGELQAKSGIFLNLLATDAGIERDHLHASLLVVESEHGKIGDDTEHSSGWKATGSPRVPAAQVSRAGDEIDMLDEASLFMLHRHHHLRQARDVVAASGAGQARLRLFRIADERTVQIAVLIDLRATHESDVDIAALQQQQHIRAAEHHVGAARAPLIVGGGRQLAGLDECADHSALEQDRQAGTTQTLREGRREKWDTDAGEDDLPVLELARAQDRQELGGGVALRSKHRKCPLRREPLRAIRRCRSWRGSRSTTSVHRRSVRDTAASPRPDPC